MAGFCKNADKLQGFGREFHDLRSRFQIEQARSCSKEGASWFIRQLGVCFFFFSLSETEMLLGAV